MSDPEPVHLSDSTDQSTPDHPLIYPFPPPPPTMSDPSDPTEQGIPTSATPHQTPTTSAPVFPRYFKPAGQGFPESTISVADLVHPNSPFSSLKFRNTAGEILNDVTTTIIFTYGIIFNEGQPSAIAGMACYFGPQSPLNISQHLEASETQSKRVAAIQAFRLALDVFERNVPYTQGNHRVVLATNAQILIECMVEYILQWRDSPAMPGSSLQLGELQELDQVIIRFEEVLDVSVQFWDVSRESNMDAIILAEQLGCKTDI